MPDDILRLPDTFERPAAWQLDHPRLALAALCAAVLIAQLDTSVVNLATPAIGTEFRTGVAPLQWVVDSYNLVYAALLLSGGLLADLYGRRLVFMGGAALFTAASLLCAAAPSVAVLLVGRILAGGGAALLLPASLAILRVAWPDPGDRAKVLGIWTGCNGLAWAIGPTLAALLISHVGWRSIFLVVVPLGLAALALAPAAVPESSHPQDRHFDALAQVLGILTLGGFAMAAIEFHDGGRLVVATALAVALAAGALFVGVEARHGPRALVPLDMFRNRVFRGTAAATAGMTFGMYGTVFLVPLAWQETGRLDPLGVGIAMLPMALIFVLVSPFSGPLANRLGGRRLAAGGVAVIGCGLALIGLTAPIPSIVPAETGLALAGLGMGLATGPLMGLAVGAVAAARSGTAAALINVARMVGATLGVAVMGTLFALAHGGPAGLRLALLLGGAVQLAGAAVAGLARDRRNQAAGAAAAPSRTRPHASMKARSLGWARLDRGK